MILLDLEVLVLVSFDRDTVQNFKQQHEIISISGFARTEFQIVSSDITHHYMDNKPPLTLLWLRTSCFSYWRGFSRKSDIREEQRLHESYNFGQQRENTQVVAFERKVLQNDSSGISNHTENRAILVPYWIQKYWVLHWKGL